MQPSLTGRLIRFSADDLIVSKTDLQGTITYVNRVFVNVSGYRERQLLGAPHRILRHPKMPRGVFRLLWNTIREDREIFAYVLNRAANGDEYWVFAHVTPSYSQEGRHVGYHSNRRAAYEDALPAVKTLYAEMLKVESAYKASADAAQAGLEFLQDRLAGTGMDYDQFVFSLSRETALSASLK